MHKNAQFIRRKILLGVAFFLFLFVLPMTLTLLKEQQSIRSKANAPIIITSPSNQTPISGSNIIIAATSNVTLGHHGVEFYLDGTLIGGDATAPYFISWDSTTAQNGSHILTVKEFNDDPRQKAYTSDALVVTVSNNPGDKTAAAITAVKAEAIQDNFAEITWVTNDKTTTQIILNGNDSDVSSTPDTPKDMLTATHTMQLTDLEPNTTYSYQIKSTDASGNTSLSDTYSFTTADEANTSVGEWQKVSGWNFPTVHASLLYTGELLLWSWNPADTNDGTKLYNPVTNQFTTIGISNNIFCSGQAVLPDGRIIVAGGHINNNVGTKNINIFDPTTRKWTAGPMMREGRWYPTVTVLPDGRTVIMTGDVSKDKMANVPEIYDPATNTISALTNISTSQLVGYSATFPVGTNKVVAMSYSTADMMLLDADAKTWTNKGKAMNNGGAAAQYRPGKIMMSGGRGSSGADTKTAVIDMNDANPTWRKGNPMAYKRYFHNLVNLPDGTVLAVGGSDNPDTSSSTGPLANEIWDPNTEQWRTVAPLSVRRMYHSTAVLLPDGRILASGGRNGKGENYDAEIYSPPYLFKGARPTITQIPSVINSGTTITVATPNTASIDQINLLKPATQTHTHDMSQHFIPLQFTKTSSGLQVQIPNDRSVLPKGYYMLFIVNSNGVPSVSKMIKVSDEVVPTVTPTQSVPTPTPTPTKTPTPTPTTKPSVSPTPTKIPTPSPTPTAKPTMYPSSIPTATRVPNQTRIAVNVLLHGIGNAGDNTNSSSLGNMNPSRKQRTVAVTMYKLDRQVVATVAATLTYNPETGSYLGNAVIPNVPTDYYQFSFKADGFLRKSLSGAQTAGMLSENKLPQISLTTGDTNLDNKLTIIDYNRILDCYSDLSAAKNCDTNKKIVTDINDDAAVNQIDYNLFLRELAVQVGD